jgi:hypothetical protein
MSIEPIKKRKNMIRFLPIYFWLVFQKETYDYYSYLIDLSGITLTQLKLL